MRRHRPIMNAMKNPIVGDPGITPVLRASGSIQPMQINFPVAARAASPAAAAQASMHPWSGNWQSQAYWAMGNASPWLPASSGPQPMGASVWVVWTGGSTGTKRFAGSNVAEPVVITSQIFGGPTGVMVTVAPAPAYASNPGRQTNQASHDRPTFGEKAKSILKNVVRMSNPMRHFMAHEAMHETLRHANPADCSDANTPADQCKWICMPMPSPSDPHDMHCVRVPKNVRLSGAYFTTSVGHANAAPTCDPATCKWICLPMPSPSDPHDMHCAQVPKNAKLEGAYFATSPGAPRTFVQRLRARFTR